MIVPSSEIIVIQRDAIKKFSKRLTPRERRVLYLRYVRNNTLDQCAEVFGLSRERIRQIIFKSLFQMRKTASFYGYTKLVQVNVWHFDYEPTRSGKSLLEDEKWTIDWQL